MKEKRKAKIIIAALSLALLAAALVASCRGHHGRVRARVEREVQALVEELRLSDEQQQQVARVRELVEEHHRQARSEREAHYQALRAAVAQGDVDPTEVQQQLDRKLEEMRQLSHSVADQLVPLVNSLDDEQREVLLAKMDRLHARMERFHPRDQDEE